MADKTLFVLKMGQIDVVGMVDDGRPLFERQSVVVENPIALVRVQNGASAGMGIVPYFMFAKQSSPVFNTNRIDSYLTGESIPSDIADEYTRFVSGIQVVRQPSKIYTGG